MHGCPCFLIAMKTLRSLTTECHLNCHSPLWDMWLGALFREKNLPVRITTVRVPFLLSRNPNSRKMFLFSITVEQVTLTRLLTLWQVNWKILTQSHVHGSWLQSSVGSMRLDVQGGTFLCLAAVVAVAESSGALLIGLAFHILSV